MLADTSCNSNLFWNNINKMNPTSSMLSDVVDNVNTPKDIAHLFVKSIKIYIRVCRQMKVI